MILTKMYAQAKKDNELTAMLVFSLLVCSPSVAVIAIFGLWSIIPAICGCITVCGLSAVHAHLTRYEE
jgi:hypothetical protein